MLESENRLHSGLCSLWRSSTIPAERRECRCVVYADARDEFGEVRTPHVRETEGTDTSPEGLPRRPEAGLIAKIYILMNEKYSVPAGRCILLKSNEEISINSPCAVILYH